MAEYGVRPEGFHRKPLAAIKADIEDDLRTQFGSDLILSPQSPMGQVVGVVADHIAEAWEQLEAIYQSHDVDQAEGTQLDTLARLRNLFRNGRVDEELRRAIDNADRGTVDVQDIAAAVSQIAGVTFSRVFVNNGSEEDGRGLPGGRVAVVVEGGSDEDIAAALRRFIAPGITLHGNTYITSAAADGYCRSFPLVRPIAVPVSIVITVNTRRDREDCPPPPLAVIKQGFVDQWRSLRENGRDVSFYEVRAIIEGAYPGVEVVSIQASRPDEDDQGINSPVRIAFSEIASIAAGDVIVAEA